MMELMSIVRVIAVFFMLFLAEACDPVKKNTFIPDITGNYAFTMLYDGRCTTLDRPGQCVMTPVRVLQVGDEIALPSLGAGVVENAVVVFGTNRLSLCDLSEADLTFAGVFDGRDINGQFSGVMVRGGFGGECKIEAGSFSLLRIE